MPRKSSKPAEVAEEIKEKVEEAVAAVGEKVEAKKWYEGDFSLRRLRERALLRREPRVLRRPPFMSSTVIPSARLPLWSRQQRPITA